MRHWNISFICLRAEGSSKLESQRLDHERIGLSKALGASLRQGASSFAGLRLTSTEIEQTLKSRWPAHRPRTKPAMMRLGSFASIHERNSSKSKVSSSFAAWEAFQADNKYSGHHIIFSEVQKASFYFLLNVSLSHRKGICCVPEYATHWARDTLRTEPEHHTRA